MKALTTVQRGVCFGVIIFNRKRTAAFGCLNNACHFYSVQTKNASYKRPMHLKMYHLLIRVQDKMRLLRRFSPFIFICICMVTFYLSYFIGARLMYPDEPANLYEWNKRKKAGQLSESSLEKERRLNMYFKCKIEGKLD
ncbi:hypothetical protein T4C_5698 [Trichinella pseudospiralis]|uniref:Uncharacterized protein n=1 Tax=Trichinella pseudospiralis TaxID=6337 RepID=A0A0V1JSD8_TRIPS|nr:hypothetical protein T4E_11459 [Trichinella pseudospiralis]KRY86152.1 hypothetical protein T4D_6709 [Trichinella pseudospiralis]KRZ37868.1 hypothetical protein T4C_5698 [Trichinella pseudospiralis]